MSGFTIDLAGLPSGASRVRLEADPSDLELEASGWPNPVRGDFLVEKGGDRISIRGRLEALVTLACVRCLKEYELPLLVPFELFAERAGTSSRFEEEVLERDDYMKFHDGRQLDVREEVRDSLLLEVPMAPHCREQCLGLCPRCGADLNEGPCRCVPLEAPGA